MRWQATDHYYRECAILQLQIFGIWKSSPATPKTGVWLKPVLAVGNWSRPIISQSARERDYFCILYLPADLLIKPKHSSRIYWNQWSVPTLFTRGERSSSWKCFNRVCNWIKSCTSSKGQRRRRRGSCSPVQDITSKRTMWIANAPWWPPND